MSRNTRVIKTTPERVWAVLADGWLYPLWVVGATRMREVDDDWPATGSRIHHSVGVWPMVLNDDTEVLECEPQHGSSCGPAAGRPGEADVELPLTAVRAAPRWRCWRTSPPARRGWSRSRSGRR